MTGFKSKTVNSKEEIKLIEVKLKLSQSRLRGPSQDKKTMNFGPAQNTTSQKNKNVIFLGVSNNSLWLSTK